MLRPDAGGLLWVPALKLGELLLGLLLGPGTEDATDGIGSVHRQPSSMAMTSSHSSFIAIGSACNPTLPTP
jgi:hypothetical protein